MVTYRGNGVDRDLSHSLGTEVGMALVKCTSHPDYSWFVYHKELGINKRLYLNSSDSSATDYQWRNTVDNTKYFGVTGDSAVN